MAALMGWKMLLNESATPVQSVRRKGFVLLLGVTVSVNFSPWELFWYSMYLFLVNSKNWVNVII